MPAYRHVPTGNVVTVDGNAARRLDRLRTWELLPAGDFEPSAFTVPEVLAHLAEVSDAEVARILEDEAEGKARAGVLGYTRS